MSEESLVGQTLAGKYRVEKVLGKGGMGVVVGARHLGLDEPVAVKILRPAMMEVDGMVARFLREARAASKIKSEHVVRVTDVDTLEDGVPYMVMEILTGVDFSQLRKQRGTYGVAEAVGYLLEACEAIAEAHAFGIVHRDLKPGNLFLHQRPDGKRVVKVLDFGISKLEAPGEQDTTKTGQMMGSPKYMAPEQMNSMHDADARSDVWSLGAILFEFLCARPPFVAESTPRICALVLNADPPLPSSLRPDVPEGLERVVLRCLEKDPARRFADVKALAAALAPYAPSAGGAAVEVPPPLPPAPATLTTTAGATVAAWDTTRNEGAPKNKPGRRRLVLLGVAVAVAAGMALLWATHGGSPVPAPAAPPAPDVSATASATATADAPKPAISPADLPDVQPSAAPGVPAFRPGAAASAKKPKPKPADDPFGGRRN
jgi:serine/threonine-protein kinase